MDKPEWADVFHEAEFDYGLEKGYCAQVGPIKQAVRVIGRRLVKEPVYGEFVKTVEHHYCEECEGEHEHETYQRELLVPGVWEKVPLMPEEEIEAQLRDFFVEKVKESEEFLSAANTAGFDVPTKKKGA